MQNVDIIIVGDSVFGLALACGLQKSGLRIVVIENGHSIHTAPCFISQSRVLAINIASEKLLNHLEVWPEIVNCGVSCFRGIELWERDEPSFFAFDSKEAGHTHIGYIVENETIRSALRKRAHQCCNITFLTSTKVQKVEWSENDAFITLQSGNKLASRLLIGSDGESSWLRRKAGIPIAFLGSRHTALIAMVRTEKMHEEIVRLVFQNDEILAFLPLRDPYLSSIVWLLDSNKARKMLEATSKVFNQELCMAFDNRLGLCVVKSKKRVLSFTEKYARCFVGHRVALVGDAAYTIHPLAGQGVNLGFMDVAELLGELRRLQKDGKDIGQYLYLRRYEFNRKYSSAIMLAGLQVFREMFVGDHIKKELLRTIGIKLIDMLPGVKLKILRKVMGIYDLPKWLR